MIGHHVLSDESATAALGDMLAGHFSSGDVIALYGPLGVGKTTLARQMIRRFSISEDIPSPTFGLVQTYTAEKFQIWHFDLYRLESADEIWELGFEEALDGGVSIIEWPEIIDGLLPETTLGIQLEMHDEGRVARLYGGDSWKKKLGAGAAIASLQETGSRK